MRITLLASAATLALAFALPSAAQTPSNPLPASPSDVTNGTPAAGTPSGLPPGQDPATNSRLTPSANTQPGSTPGAVAPNVSQATATPPDQAAPGAPAGATTADQSAPPPAHRHHRMHHAASQDAQQASYSGGSTQWAHEPGTGESGPASSRASNIDGADTSSAIAPHLPQPAGGEGAGPNKYLRDADRALQNHKTGLAQQALEMAETRLLDRSTPATDANQTDQAPAIQQVSDARKELASGNIQGARSAIQNALADRSPGGGMSGGGMANDNASMQGSPAPASAPAMQGGSGNAEAGHVIGSGTGGGPLGTPSNDSAGGAR